MTTAEQVRLTLELDPTPGAMRGSLTDTHGERRDFDGWVQLANALRTAHAATQPPPQKPHTGSELRSLDTNRHCHSRRSRW
jgi:hypothetical protein